MKPKSFFINLVIFIFSFIWILNFAIRGIDIYHDAIVFIPALDVVNGKTLLRETFFPYGILTTYIHVFFIEIFGKQLLSIKLASTFFYSLTALFLWLSTKKITPNIISLITVILWIMLAPYFNNPFHSWAPIYGAFFQLMTLYIFISYNKKLDNSKLFIMGIFSALAFWSKQTFLLLFLSINTYLLLIYFLKIINFKKLKSNMFYLGLGFIVISSLFLTSIILTSSLNDFWLQTIRTGYTTGRIISNSFNLKTLFFDLLEYPVFFIFPFCLIYFFGRGIANILKKKDLKNSLFYIGISFISTASLATIYPASDSTHIYWAITPIFGIAAYFLFLIYKSNVKNLYIKLFLITIIIVVLFQSFFNLKFAYEKTNNYTHSIDYRNITNGLYVSSEQYDQLSDYQKEINKYFNNNPEKKLLFLHGNAILLTFSERDTRIGPFLYNYSGFTSGIYPEYLEKVEFIIKNQKPLIIHEKRYAKSYDNYKVLKIYPLMDVVILEPKN